MDLSESVFSGIYRLIACASKVVWCAAFMINFTSLIGNLLS